MSTAIARDKPRRRWLIPAITSVVALIVGVFGNIIAPKIEKLFGGDYFGVIWLIFAIASVLTIIIAIREARRNNNSLSSTNNNNFNVKITNVTTNIYDAISYRRGSAPPLPSLIIGREDALRDLKARLSVASASVQVLTAVRGWPGVGKTTVASALAYDPDVRTSFPDGVLWVSLGQTPSLLSELAAWGRALGTDDLLKAKTVEEASARLAAFLLNRRMLLIVDDVWKPEHAIPFKIGGQGCAILITTRDNSVARALAPTPDHVYNLPVLTEDKALELLKSLATSVVAEYPQQSLLLVRELEGLPLAIQVAGHLLNVEASYGFGVTNLLNELREGAKLLAAKAPADRVDVANETTPTVAVLLQKSTDHLDNHTRDCFAYLGAFAPKPATFDLAAMKVVWQVEDPKPTARILVDRGLLLPIIETDKDALKDISSVQVDRGLLEPIIETGRFQMHALLVMHAKSLLTEE